MVNNKLIGHILMIIFFVILIFHLGWNLGNLYSKEEPVYCIWKLETNSNSSYPDAVIWEDVVGRTYKEYELYQKVLEEGNIKSIDTKCYYFGLNADGTRIEVKP